MQFRENFLTRFIPVECGYFRSKGIKVSSSLAVVLPDRNQDFFSKWNFITVDRYLVGIAVIWVFKKGVGIRPIKFLVVHFIDFLLLRHPTAHEVSAF